jgi:uncharacterized protein
MSVVLPTFEQIKFIHLKYAPNKKIFDQVWEHCLIVRDIALQLAETSQVEVNVKLVEVGCLLHDVGVYSLYGMDGSRRPENYITHGVLGEQILKLEGYPENIYRFGSHHTGVGITKDQIVKNQLPLPYEDFVAESVEEELVMYADKFHSKSTPPVFNSYDYYAAYTVQFGEDSVKTFTRLGLKFGKPELSSLVSLYGHNFR